MEFTWLLSLKIVSHLQLLYRFSLCGLLCSELRVKGLSTGICFKCKKEAPDMVEVFRVQDKLRNLCSHSSS